MKKVDFTKKFYKKVYEALCDYCEKNYENDNNDKYGVCLATVTVDGYEIEANCNCECEIKDESFDHAFGTWQDPFAGYYFSDVYSIEDVNVWDEEGDVVEGFSIEAYDNMFIEEEYKDIKKGDRVVHRYRGKYSDIVGTVLFFNTRNYTFCVEEEIYGRPYKKSYSYYDLKKIA